MFRPLPVVRKQFEKPPNFKYLCPFDPQVIGPESVDIAYSRTVLEHIDPNTLQQLLSDIFNLLKSGGITIHIIDNSDHFEHRNRSLSQVDFLRYSDRLWRLTHFNAQNYQNRLRHSDYLPIFEGAGFDVIEFSGEPGATALEDIKRMKLAPRFRRYDAEDLAILTTYVAARKPLL